MRVENRRRGWRLSRVVPLFLAFATVGSANAAFTEQGATILGGANYSARSVSLADIDNDGDLDAYFQGSTSSARQLWRNNTIGSGSPAFTNITSSMLPSGLSSSWSSAWADYNGDGLVDVFIGQTNSSGNTGTVLRNNPWGFSNVSASTGLNDPGFHQNVGWADIDNDRDLDLLIGMEGPFERHEVYLQGPSGSFTPVGAQTGFQVAHGTKAYGMAIGDTDGDGDLDVYISTCRSAGNIRNNFFQNMLVETGTLGFVDIADSNGTQFYDNSYGSEFIDLDNDGDLDLYMTGADGSDTKIWRNDGGNQFTDVDSITGHKLLSTNGVDFNGSKAVDYDNDGDLDLYFHDNLSANGNQRLFRNDGGWQFTDVTAIEGLDTAAGGAPVGAGAYDSAWGDLDLDGDQDLITPNNSTLNGVPTPERVYISDASTNGNHWLYVELDGPAYNTTGVGASVYAEVAEGELAGATLRREANTNPGTFNQSDLPVHFGLADAATIEELRVVWPDGTKQTVGQVAANQRLTISYLPGDYSGDGVVDAADYVVWRDGLGGVYQQSDYLVWRDNFGASLATDAGSTIPEPVATGLACLIAMACGFRRAR
ncbi:FG-GAP repeat protein [Posidoniimonas corsicana]|uniref:FG-GAP repeat protein n=1 Tax=Posidoniimonas corsicana TaxID=1938618 RepID=A0A5C5V5X2_9BACT|nr:CRTAC1 family protein [Posidoniimonas corsicana]TWT33936.1 FG-GAP repeat protein [Posidoniimonas corsicana]